MVCTQETFYSRNRVSQAKVIATSDGPDFSGGGVRLEVRQAIDIRRGEVILFEMSDTTIGEAHAIKLRN